MNSAIATEPSGAAMGAEDLLGAQGPDQAARPLAGRT